LELRQEGTTIMYSTHILPDVEMTCDRVSIIYRGHTRRTGRLAEILAEATRGVSVVVAQVEPARFEKLKLQHPSARLVEGAVQRDSPEPAAARAFTGMMLAEGAELLRSEPHRDDLEAIFVRTLHDPLQKPISP